jgi:hypothetical protein
MRPTVPLGGRPHSEQHRRPAQLPIEVTAEVGRWTQPRVAPDVHRRAQGFLNRRERRYFNSTAILSAARSEAFSSACVAAPDTRTSSAFALVWSFR